MTGAPKFGRIAIDARVMDGRACIRGYCICASLVANLVGNGMSVDEVLAEYPDLEADDISQASGYVAAKSRRQASQR
jgi:uncharacterized protein (DUF433 family)